ncbi:hypothetical protein L218DRAFT_361422 [Marasmius fiardii PR-910]|nr:hypothetical protein L218DRAFT_361422 [Marasmius fiardii PR-910]
MEQPKGLPSHRVAVQILNLTAKNWPAADMTRSIGTSGSVVSAPVENFRNPPLSNVPLTENKPTSALDPTLNTKFANTRSYTGPYPIFQPYESFRARFDTSKGSFFPFLYSVVVWMSDLLLLYHLPKVPTLAQKTAFLLLSSARVYTSNGSFFLLLGPVVQFG